MFKKKKDKDKNTPFSLSVYKLSIIHIKVKRHLSAFWISLTLFHLESSYTATQENLSSNVILNLSKERF